MHTHQAQKIIEGLPRASFQARVYAWLITCFGEEITFNRPERNHRFLEEALELVQSLNCPREDAHMLVDYVYNRPVGEPKQEAGGAIVTLAALCVAHGYNLEDLGEIELARAWSKIEQIRAKQKSKPKNSPLPGTYPERATDMARRLANTPVSVCEHESYSFDLHGRCCPQCGIFMVDTGD
jgi:hypothetical protein